jgi:UDP-2,3-diacylglucosamine hydrolase
MMDIRAQSVLACSDMHLGDARPALTDAFVRWLHRHTLQAARPPEVLLVLGDAFDAWVGDDALVHAAPSSCGPRLARALRSVSKAGIRVLMMHGNRDFLLGKAFADQAGCELLGDTARLMIQGGPAVAVTHGDILCTRDTAYLAFRQMVRNPDWQQAFLAKPLQERTAIAQSLREKSTSETAMKAEDIVDVTIDECEAMVRTMVVDALLHGHTHRPGLSVMPSGAPRWVLPDWAIHDATGALARGGGLWIDPRGATSL